MKNKNPKITEETCRMLLEGMFNAHITEEKAKVLAGKAASVMQYIDKQLEDSEYYYDHYMFIDALIKFITDTQSKIVTDFMKKLEKHAHKFSDNTDLN